jgi:hypothetical protein
MTKQYEVIIYTTIEADSLEEAEELYAMGEWSIDYHEICDYDDNGNEIKYDQWDIMAMEEEKENDSN